VLSGTKNGPPSIKLQAFGLQPFSPSLLPVLRAA
jgi:hypothetical protein